MTNKVRQGKLLAKFRMYYCSKCDQVSNKNCVLLAPLHPPPSLAGCAEEARGYGRRHLFKVYGLRIAMSPLPITVGLGIAYPCYSYTFRDTCDIINTTHRKADFGDNFPLFRYKTAILLSKADGHDMFRKQGVTNNGLGESVVLRASSVLEESSVVLRISRRGGPQNGKGDLKNPDKEAEAEEKSAQEEEKTAETDGEAEKQDEEIVVVAKKRAPSFFQKLFGGRKAAKQDVEAGTELLSKDGKPAEIKPEEDGKNEKTDSGTDVTVAITDENDAAAESAKVREVQNRVYMKRVLISLACIILVLTLVVLVTTLTASDQSSRGPLGDPLVITECGPVKGYKDNGIYVFKGIPYALPPVGELRWKPPMQASSFNECWTGTYEAYNSSAICYQKPIPGQNLEMSEDCLYLDIVTPSLSPPVLRPVVFYIPGDHPLKGYTADDVNWRPTASIADSRDVTFVTLNYRTNALGFLVLDLLTNRMRPPTSGNYGIMDMLAALQWVQRNIRSFGGDPQKITVLAHGGSATAGLALLSSKKAKGLFSQMWLTAPSARFSNKSLEQISTDNAGMLRKLNCDNVSCLYNKTSEEILAAVPGLWYSDWSTDLPSSEEEQNPVMAVVDGNILYNTPYHMWKEDDIQQVPVVIGSAAQESGSSKVLHDLDKWSWTDFSDYVSEKLESISDNITVSALQFYIQNSSTPLQQFHTM
ncbi:neurotactin, partial [Caerostris extrusa]